MSLYSKILTKHRFACLMVDHVTTKQDFRVAVSFLANVMKVPGAEQDHYSKQTV